MDVHEILATVAEVSATFIGFTGIVIAIGRYSASPLLASERMGLFYLLIPASITLFFALVTYILLYDTQDELLFWRWATALLGIVSLVAVSDGTRKVLRGEAPKPIWLQVGMLPFGYLQAVSLLAVGAGYFLEFAAKVFLIGLVWLLFVSVIQFILLVLSRQVPARDSP